MPAAAAAQVIAVGAPCAPVDTGAVQWPIEAALIAVPPTEVATPIAVACATAPIAATAIDATATAPRPSAPLRRAPPTTATTAAATTCTAITSAAPGIIGTDAEGRGFAAAPEFWLAVPPK